MGDILKEAIADAKAVRETALQNAKMALEEAFTPQLKSMLSAKLREDDLEGELEDVPAEEQDDEEIPAEEMGYSEEESGDGMDSGEVGDDEEHFGDEEGGDVPSEEEDFMSDEEGEPQGDVPSEEGGVEGEEDDIIEINGVKYAPIVSEEEDEMSDEVPAEEDEEDSLDLESVIKELESEINEEEELSKDSDATSGVEETDNAYDEDDPGEQPEHQGGQVGESFEVNDSLFEEDGDDDDDDDDDDEVNEISDSSDIGTGDNKVDVAGGDDEEDLGNAGADLSGNIGEVKEELRQYKEAVIFLKDKLHEVNILNAKLLFTNKLFKEFVLDNSAKMKVVENFDRAQTVREIKLVYATLAEGFKDNSGVKRKSINESASKRSGTTKPSKATSKKVINEENQIANRFKKLAGLK